MLRAAIFMDHSNVASPILKKKEFKDYVINYRKFRKILIDDFTCVGTYAFMGITKPIKPEKQKFMNYLETSGFNTFPRELIKKSDGSYEQKGLDTYMSLYIDSKMSEFDVAIIVTGDADFIITVEILRNSLKDVRVWSWKDSMSKDLLKKAGKENVFYIDSIWDKIKKKRDDS